MKKLNRTLGLPAIIAISIAGMLGGIFVIPGIAAVKTGSSIWLAFLLAAICIVPAVLSKSELATAMPATGGAYVYIERALGPLFGTISGLGLWISLLLKSSFALVGLGAYLLVIINIQYIYIKYIALIFLFLIMLLNIFGIKKVGSVQIFIISISLLSLIGLLFIGFPSVDKQLLDPFFINGEIGLVSAIAFVFVAYAGVTKIAAIAGEVKNPGINIPRAMIFSLVLITCIYILLSYILVGNIPLDDLATDIKPIYSLALVIGNESLAYCVAIIGVLTLISLANSGVLASSRFPFAMSIDKLLPSMLSKVHNQYLTPINTILITCIAMALVIIFLDVEKIAKLASAFKVLMFILVNLSVIVLRESGVQWYKPTYKSMLYPYMQLFGIISGLILIFCLGLMPIIILLVIIIIGILIYLNYGKRASRIGVLKRYGHIPALYLIGRTNKDKSANVIKDKYVDKMVDVYINKDASVIIPLLGDEISPSNLIELGFSLSKEKELQVLNINEVPDQTALEAFEDNTPKSNALKRLTNKLSDSFNKPIFFDTIVTHKLTETIRAISEVSNIKWMILGWNGRAQNGIFFNNPLGWIISHINSNFGLFKCSGLQKFDKILLALRPDSHDSLKLINITNLIANHYNTSFVVLNVVPVGTSNEVINSIKQEAEKKLKGCNGTIKIIISDHPIDKVSSLTAEYDLLVLGTPRKDTLKTVLFGTGKDKFAVKATCSVLRLTLNNWNIE